MTTSSPPPTVRVLRENIPSELTGVTAWLNWRWKHLPDARKPWTKPPVSPHTMRDCDAHDPASWAPLDVAMLVYERGVVAGIGIDLDALPGIVGIDLDHCVTEDGIAAWAQEIIDQIDSYTEISPSGTGVRILLRGTLPVGGRKRGDVETYESGRYLTITGQRTRDRGIEERQAELEAFHAERFPERAAPAQSTWTTPHFTDYDVVELAFKAANGAKVRALYGGDNSLHAGDASSVDLALLSALAFWTQDAGQLDRIFRGSPRMRAKWDERHSGDGRTYGAMTVDTALSGVGETYSPNGKGPASERPYSASSAPPESPGDTEDSEAERQRRFDEAVAREVETLRIREAARREFVRQQAERSPLPDARTLAAWLEEPDAPETWRIEGWQPAASRVVLAAQYKAGKTTIVGNLARVLADGGRFLGTGLVTPLAGRVVILDDEMSPRQLKAWLRDQGIRDADRVVAQSLKGKASMLDIMDEERRAEWVAWLRAVECEYLILDCLRPIMDALALDENHDAGRFLVALDALLVDADIPDACLVHHMGHAGERSRGDSRIRDWPDVEWRLVRQDVDDPASPRFIAAFGRDVEIAEVKLHYDTDTRHLTLSEGNRKDAGAEEAISAIVEALESGPMTGRAIHRALAEETWGKDKINRALELAQGRGAIGKRPWSGRGKGFEYYITRGVSEVRWGEREHPIGVSELPYRGSSPQTPHLEQADEVSEFAHLNPTSAYRRACLEPGCIGNMTLHAGGMWVCDEDNWHKTVGEDR